MKLSNVFLLSAVLMLGTSFAAAQNSPRADNRDGYLQTVQYNGAYGNNNDYQRGFQDGINSGRADANGNKRFNLGSHPYYTNSNNQAYRQGFSQGYRQAYGQVAGNNGYYGNNGRYGNNGYYGNNGRYGNNGYYGNNGRYNNNGYYDNNGNWHERHRDRDHDRDRDRDHDRDRDDQPHL